MKQAKLVFKMLKDRGWHIGIMESCTGGAIANAITNFPGSSEIFKLGLVTYSNEAKIKCGVSSKIIHDFGVYSSEVAKEMAKVVGEEVGVGVTGELPGRVYVCIRIKNKYFDKKLRIKDYKLRERMKGKVVTAVFNMMLKSIKIGLN